MKILYFTKYSRKGASSRLRSFQYIPYLESQGYEIEVQSLFDDQYLTDLYMGKRNHFQTIIAYGKRFLSLCRIHKFDFLYIEKELFPYLPAWTEQMLYFLKIRYIVDYDDAIFHNYDMSSNTLVRTFLSKKIDVIMNRSTHVITGNKYLASRAREAEAKNISIIPTVIDLNRYSVKKQVIPDKIIVGWIGTKSTFEKHFSSLIPVIQFFESNPKIEFHVIGVTAQGEKHKNIKFFEWSESEEVEMIKQFDIGIMPLVDSNWEKGKCAYKLIQYMACGLPVVCSPVGMNTKVVLHEWNGYYANSTQEWQEAIRRLVENKDLRKILGRNGRLSVENDYNLQLTSRKLLDIFNSV